LLALQDNDAQRYFFLKAHRRERVWAGTALARYRLTEGVKEWRNILALQSAGIPTASPVAAGERVISDGGRESFVMTLRLDGYLPLDRYIAERFVPPLPPSVRREKLMMIRAVADLARRMHGMGFNHQDFYLCHIFAKIAESGLPDLKLIDLQRVGHRRFPKRRWVVKDLAQLYYSSLALPLTRVDRARFLVRYAATASRQAYRRDLLLSIAHKARAIEKHDAKIQARRPSAERSDPFDVSMRLGQSSSPHELDRRK
jgi:heptose I phosphotransferase